MRKINRNKIFELHYWPIVWAGLAGDIHNYVGAWLYRPAWSVCSGEQHRVKKIVEMITR